MIAKVRLAPTEQWCPKKLAVIDQEKLRAGQNMEMLILTETMKKCQWCDGRAWVQEQNNVNELRAKVGLPPSNEVRWLCEHMLEMD